VKLTTHLHLVQRLRMRGAIPLLPPYVFIAWCLVEHRDSSTFTFTLNKICTPMFRSKIYMYITEDHVVWVPVTMA